MSPSGYRLRAADVQFEDRRAGSVMAVLPDPRPSLHDRRKIVILLEVKRPPRKSQAVLRGTAGDRPAWQP
jgi:hypothetical protein